MFHHVIANRYVQSWSTRSGVYYGLTFHDNGCEVSKGPQVLLDISDEEISRFPDGIHQYIHWYTYHKLYDAQLLHSI